MEVYLLLFCILSLTFSKILDLDSNSLNNILATNDYVFVEFMAKWCAHSRKFFPRYETVSELIEEHKIPVILGRIDIDENLSLAESYNVEAYPTFLFFHKSQVINYTSDLDEQNMLNWLSKHTKPLIQTISTNDEFLSFRETHPVSFFMIGQDNDDFYEKYNKAVIKSLETNFAVITNLQVFDVPVRSGPCVVVFKKSDEKFALTYDFDNLQEFFNKHMIPWVGPLNDLAIKEIFGKARPALFMFSQAHSVIDELNQASEIIKGSLLSVYLDAKSKHHIGLIEKLGLEDFKQPFALILDKNMRKFVKEDVFEAKDIVKFYEEWKNNKARVYYKSEKNVYEENGIWNLNGESFNMEVSKGPVVVYFYIKDCGYCRMFEAEYEALAEKYKGQMRFAKVNCSKNDIEGVRITEFPTVLYYSGESLQGVQYLGPFTEEMLSVLVESFKSNPSVKTDL
ncbi:hypothetical protein SteCoe_33377 [Stentor coeruleus]|uniref:Thioredoxin domain-containing protein n=1 Tax=Stentor coeruleus TaxID=5963 RepID=A0A1R2AWY3_9CILI|nr:hypothetical protein SteCoe_33377 [Stentor coeruleus]